MATKQSDPRAQARAAVLRSWIALERFDTKTLERPDPHGRPPRGRRRFAVDIGPRDPLPWESGHVAYGQPLVSDKVEWRHTLHLGQFDIGAAYERVEAVFPDSEEARELRRTTRGTAPLLAMSLTPDGRPIMDSLQVSSAAWSIAQTLRLGVDDPKWLVGFDDALGEVRGAFERIVIDSAGGDPASDAGRSEAVGSEAAAGLRVVPDPSSEGAVPEAGPDAPEEPDDSNIIEAIDDEGIAVEPITWDHVLRLLGAATAILETEGQLTIRPVVRSTTWAESRRVPYGTGDTLLNSFAVDDLERVARKLEDHAPGAALARYLDAAHVAVDEAADRIDVDERLDAVRAQTDPSRMPAGRWPADATHDLALGQQVAVNLALGGSALRDPTDPADRPASHLDDAPMPIVAVNGPPGTGKTTMLRDLIAAVVTERADVIAAFKQPGDLFKGEALSVSGDRVVRVSKLARGVAGREILLACATNAAAQNVSLELPDLGAIDPEWRAGSGYLADFATAALRAGALSDLRFGEGQAGSRGAGARRPADALTLDGFDALAPAPPSDDPHALQAWAMVAARLGRRSYCKDFAGAVWWGTAPRPGDRGGWSQAPKIAPTERAERGLAALLNGTQNADGRQAWAESRDRYLAARARVEAIRAERQGVADALVPADDLERQSVEAELELDGWLAEAERLDAERTEAAEAAAPLVLAHAAAKKALEALGEAPAAHLLKRLTPAGREREGVRKNALAKADLAHRDAKTALDRVHELDRHAAQARREASRCKDALSATLSRLTARADAAQDAADGAMPFVVPGEAWEQDRALRDLRAPWSDDVWNRARTDCFLAALDLHEATLLANGRDARRNLAVAIDLLTGRVTGLTRDVVLAAWQTLFLLVPVVSTTFASLPTMLTGLGQEDLGWLLIDEAGQAQPQQAAGAIWRCKRAVIVGDPLQLEPVSGLPSSLADAIRTRYDVPIAYVSPEASVQRLADAVMPWGGHRGELDLWVGVPMNVHRRCEDPIFDLVNAIAYDGRMVNATVARVPHPALRVETCWLDVPSSGGASEGHWILEEGARLDALLEHLGMNGYDFRQVFAVSPFRDVAWQLRRRAEDPRHPGMVGGTIHTIQGREADTVIVVLGGDPTKPGARQWVADKPNLLNVAVSRARQRLYVIGDYDRWIDLPYLRELSGLRRVAPRAAGASVR